MASPVQRPFENNCRPAIEVFSFKGQNLFQRSLAICVTRKDSGQDRRSPIDQSSDELLLETRASTNIEQKQRQPDERRGALAGAPGCQLVESGQVCKATRLQFQFKLL